MVNDDGSGHVRRGCGALKGHPSNVAAGGLEIGRARTSLGF